MPLIYSIACTTIIIEDDICLTMMQLVKAKRKFALQEEKAQQGRARDEAKVPYFYLLIMLILLFGKTRYIYFIKI